TFDVTRYLLPLATTTNVGQVVSIRTLEKQICRLLSLPVVELRAIGEDLKRACANPPLNVWGELNGPSAAPNEPLAPTLARHARPSDYLIKTYPDLKQAAAERLRLGAVEASEPVELIDPHAPLDELAATLLYRVTVYPYRQILAVVREWTEQDKADMIDNAPRRRSPHDERLQAFRCRTRCLLKMDYAEAEYMARLRSGVKGHFSYRTIAWLMQQAVLPRYPALGTRIAATPPDIEDSLSR